MAIQNINGHSHASPTSTASVGSNNPSSPSETSETQSNLLSIQVDHGTEPSQDADIPPPNGDPNARDEWLADEIKKLDRLIEKRDDLEAVLDETDPDSEEYKKAQYFLEQIDLYQERRDSYQAERDAIEASQARRLDDGDGDGVVNQNDPDDDNDGLTDIKELELGTNPFDIDGDHDGLRDVGEIELRTRALNGEFSASENERILQITDPNNADADSNGYVDSHDLPESLHAKYVVGAPQGNSTDGSSVQNQTAQWPQPSEPVSVDQATTAGNYTLPPGGDLDVTLPSGETKIQKDGTSLTLKNESGTITIEGFFNENGKPIRRLWLHGDAQIQFLNTDPSTLTAPTTDAQGNVTGGINYGSIDVSSPDSIYDPFGGTLTPVSGSNSSETIYDVSSVTENTTFQMPDKIGGTEVKRIQVTVEGNDVIIELKDANDETLKKIRLQNGLNKATGQNPLIRFQLADNGQLLEASGLSLIVSGGRKNDSILVGGGSVVHGGKGDDTLSVGSGNSSNTGGVKFFGDDGADLLIGGKGNDHLEGGLGDDMIKGGEGSDILLGGDDSDLIFGDNDDSQIDGGEGYNISNLREGDHVRSVKLGFDTQDAYIQLAEQKVAEYQAKADDPNAGSEDREAAEEQKDVWQDKLDLAKLADQDSKRDYEEAVQALFTSEFNLRKDKFSSSNS